MTWSTDEIHAVRPTRSLSSRIYFFGLIFASFFTSFSTVQCWISTTVPLTLSLYVGLTPLPSNFHIAAAMAVNYPTNYRGANGNEKFESIRYSSLAGYNLTRRGQPKVKPIVNGGRRFIYLSGAAPSTDGVPPSGDAFNNVYERTTSASTITSTTSRIIVTSATLPLYRSNKPSSPSPISNSDDVIFPTSNNKKYWLSSSPSSTTAKATLASPSSSTTTTTALPSSPPMTTVALKSGIRNSGMFVNETNANKLSDMKNTTSTTTLSDNIGGVGTSTKGADEPIFREIISATPSSCPPTQKLDSGGKCREVY